MKKLIIILTSIILISISFNIYQTCLLSSRAVKVTEQNKLIIDYINNISNITNKYNNCYSDNALIKKNFRDDESIIKSLKSEPHRQRPTPKKT